MSVSQALIDRPDEVRRVENFKRLQLTSYKLEIPKLAKKKALKTALESDGKTKLSWSTTLLTFASRILDGAHRYCHCIVFA